VDDLLVLTALALEALAVPSGSARVVTVGLGPARARRAAETLASDPARSVAVLGLGGALDRDLEPGHVVVADEVCGPDGARVGCDHAAMADALERAGLRVTVGRIASADHVVRGAERQTLAGLGARAVDMESFWLSPLARGRAFSIARVIVDTPDRELTSPLRTLVGGWRALRVLRRVGRVVASRAREA
jgi:4-hydroxy-3-methylbut-2-enyl diphosphate reductase